MIHSNETSVDSSGHMVLHPRRSKPSWSQLRESHILSRVVLLLIYTGIRLYVSTCIYSIIQSRMQL